MKTLLHFKNEQAKLNGYLNWHNLVEKNVNIDVYFIDSVANNAAEQYAEQHVQKWISVNDYLPKFDQIVPVQLHIDGNVDFVMGYRTEASIATDNREGWVVMNKFWPVQDEITCWTPLPN
jgi:hypothetical protein